MLVCLIGWKFSWIHLYFAIFHPQAAANNGEGPDIILEMLANVNLEEDLRIARFKGRIVIIGSRGSIEVTPRLAMTKELAVHGMLLFKADMVRSDRISPTSLPGLC